MRKIVSMTPFNGTIVAVCDDGTLWRLEVRRDQYPFAHEWVPAVIPPIPQGGPSAGLQQNTPWP